MKIHHVIIILVVAAIIGCGYEFKRDEIALYFGTLHKEPAPLTAAGAAAAATGSNGVPSEDIADVAGRTSITVPAALQQRIGVTTGLVEKGPLAMEIRAVGIVQADETKVAHIHIRTDGWVDKIFVGYVGQKVKKNDPLLSIYSPQFYLAEQEYVIFGGFGEDQKSNAESSLTKLRQWDVPPEEIKRLKETRTPGTSLVLRSLIDGTVLTKSAFQGQYITSMNDLYVVADLSVVWVQAKIFEYELPHITLGQKTVITLDALPGQEFTGNVQFIAPVVDEISRTVEVRVELKNNDGLFKPGMFGQIKIGHAMGEGLLVSSSAIIRTGSRNIAFRVDANDRFVPVDVDISPLMFEGRFQVLKGLAAGDRVVTSANFLIDSESRLQAGGGGMAGMAGMDMGSTKGTSGMSGKDTKPTVPAAPAKIDHKNMKGMEGMDDMEGDGKK